MGAGRFTGGKLFITIVNDSTQAHFKCKDDIMSKPSHLNGPCRGHWSVFCQPCLSGDVTQLTSGVKQEKYV